MASQGASVRADLATAEILPTEIWELLLNKLEDPKDLYSAHNSCFTFRMLLTDKRSTFLFPSVLPILMKRFVENVPISDRRQKDGDTRELNEFDKSLLWSRSVCKSWRVGVDSYLQSWETCHRLRNDELPYYNMFDFQDLEDVEKFMEKMANHTKRDNPFVTGFVTLVDCEILLNDDEVVRFWEAVTSSLLPKFGHHISYCEIYNWRISEVEPRGYAVLAQILNQLPTLRFLDVAAIFRDHADLPEEVRRTPLPAFKNLRGLSVSCSGITVTNELLRAARNCQLQSLSVDVKDVKGNLLNSPFWHLLPQFSCLEDATLSEFSSYKSLIRLSNVSWSIKKLDLTVKLADQSDTNEDRITLHRLFQALNVQGDKTTIRYLKLNLLGPGKIDSDLRLNLPLLEHLGMTSDYDEVAVTSLDFAVAMKALKSLSIDIDVNPLSTVENKTELLKLSGFVTDMKRSNIWTVLPNLEKLSLRDEFDQRFAYCR